MFLEKVLDDPRFEGLVLTLIWVDLIAFMFEFMITSIFFGLDKKGYGENEVSAVYYPAVKGKYGEKDR